MTTQTLPSDHLTNSARAENPRPAVLTAPPARSTADTVKALPSAIRSEWLKVISLRSNLAIMGLTAAVSGLATWAIARFVSDVTTTAELFTFPTVFVAVFAATAGILMFSSESQHGTLTPTMTGQPSRIVVAASKTVVAAVVGMLLVLISMAVAAAGSAIGGNAVGETANMVNDGVRALAFGSMAATLGLGIGMITRQSAAAISGLLAWWLLVENLITLFVSERYTRFMPFIAGNNMLGTETGPEAGFGASDLALSTAENVVVFGGYAAAAVAIGTALLYARDDA